MSQEYPTEVPAQHQDNHPGLESEMTPAPIYLSKDYKPAGKLAGKVALVTGADSGIGRAVAVLFAHEGADVAVSYYNENEDAQVTKREIEATGRKCLLLSGDLGVKAHCEEIVEKTVAEFGKLDILVNNAAEQYYEEEFENISEEQLTKTFRTNIIAYFFMAQSAMKHLKEGANIINTCSVNAFKGNKTLIDYSSTKGAIVAFTRSLALATVEKGIRVNSVAPGPIWTPFIPSTIPGEEVPDVASEVPMKRYGQPFEVATSYVFLASEDASYMTGQTLHPNGGSIVNA